MNFRNLYLVLGIVICFFGMKAQKDSINYYYAQFQSISSSAEKLAQSSNYFRYFLAHDSLHKSKQLVKEVEKLQVDKESANYKEGLVLFYNATIFNHQHSFDSAAPLLMKAIPLLKSNMAMYAEATSALIKSLSLLGRFDVVIKIGETFCDNYKNKAPIYPTSEILQYVGRAYDYLGNREKGLKYTFDGLDYALKTKDVSRISDIYINLATIYKEENFKLSLEYGLKARHLLESQKNKDHINDLAVCYLMLGNSYMNIGNLDSSRYYYLLSKDFSERSNDLRTYYSAIGNLGNLELELKNYDKAIDYSFQTLNHYKQTNIVTEVMVSYGSLADIYKAKKEYKLAILYYDTALIYTKKLNSAEDYIYNYKGLYEIYEDMGRFKEAFQYYKLYKTWNDSVNNNQNSKKISAMELEFKYKVEQREKDLIQQNKDLITQEKIKQQKYIIWSGVIGGVILIVFLGFTIKSNIERKKTNAQLQASNLEIVEQKNIIEEKNNEITDSITYASRIQQGIIPDDDELKKLFPQHFVLFKPRDIVSGDFYWAKRVTTNKNRALIALADCTGHGVPGAFMSLVGNTLLNQVINNPLVSNPAHALDYINEQLPKTIKSKSSTGSIKDGMEMAMCDIDYDTLTLQFAGANSNIYIVRENQIQIYKGDKQPIGESLTGKPKPFNNYEISLQKGDCIFMLSDGYADQFGGEKGKKFKYKPLEDLFVSIAIKDTQEQYQVLENTFETWKSFHQQVDDVLVIGIKI